MPEAARAERERLCRLLDADGVADLRWRSVADEVRAGAQVIDIGRFRPAPALAMMQLRAEAMPGFPMDIGALETAARTDPDRQLRYVTVFGSTVDAQVFVDESGCVVLCWVVPVGAGVVPVHVGPRP